jgi:hypothetical protein
MNVANPKHANPDFYVFGIIDFYGNIHRDVVTDTCDTIYIEGQDKRGAFVCFESDAYHLEKWAKENEFIYLKQGYTYESLGEPLTSEVKNFEGTQQ